MWKNTVYSHYISRTSKESSCDAVSESLSEG